MRQVDGLAPPIGEIMINRLKCFLFGHKRGKRVEQTDTIKCPRCESTWTRKAVAEAPA